MTLSTEWSSPTVVVGAGAGSLYDNRNVVDATTSSCSTFSCALGYEHIPDALGVVCTGEGSESSCSLLRCCRALGNRAGIPGSDVQAAAGNIWLAVAGSFAAFACMLATAGCSTWFVRRQMLLRRPQEVVAHATGQEDVQNGGRTAPVTLVGNSNSAAENSACQPVQADAPPALNDETVRATLQSINACSQALLAVAGSMPQAATTNAVVPHRRAHCLRHRSLKPFVVPWSSGNFRCDECSRDLSEGQAMWSCRDCNAGLCSGCGARAELLPACPDGHSLSVLRGGRASGRRGAAVCRVCRKQTLEQSNVEFLHCSLCNYDACIECAAREASPRGMRRSRRTQHHNRESGLDMAVSWRPPAADDLEELSRLSPPFRRPRAPVAEDLESASSLTMSSAVLARPGPVPLELGAACRGPELSDSLAAEHIGCQLFGSNHDQLCRESSDGSNMDWALETVNATAARVSSLLRKVEIVRPSEKGKILEHIERLENSPDYRAATEIVMRGSPTPSVVRFDPLGGALLR